MYKLTPENYYSKEADKEYCSASQFKRFISLGTVACEARALAELNGEWNPAKTEALIYGSIVDYLFENDGKIEGFEKVHPDINILSTRGATKGEILATYKKAIDIYKRAASDKLFSLYMSGEKQRIFVGEISGVPFKCKIDSYIPDNGIVDLKTTRSITKAFRIPDLGYVSFIEKYGYFIQLAIYQELVRQNTGKKLNCYISAVSKEEEPDIAIIALEQTKLDEALETVKLKANMVQMLKNGEAEPVRCEHCDYCRHTKVLTKAIWSGDIIMTGEE